MNHMQILDRLVSIKSNAHQRAFLNSMENPGCDPHHIKAETLESGINGLIMELQNYILVEELIKNQNEHPLVTALGQLKIIV